MWATPPSASDANIGAGAIFVNYDGVHKHHTTIGDAAFVGSRLDAGRAASRSATARTSAAGSAIDKDVPAGRARRDPGAAAQHRGLGRAEAGRHEVGQAAAAGCRSGPDQEIAPSPDGMPRTARLASGDTALNRVSRLTDGSDTPMSSISTENRKTLMLFSGRAYPDLADEIGQWLGVAPTPTDIVRLRERRDLRPVQGVGPRLGRVRGPVDDDADQQVADGDR